MLLSELVERLQNHQKAHENNPEVVVGLWRNGEIVKDFEIKKIMTAGVGMRLVIYDEGLIQDRVGE